VTEALGITLEENLENIAASVAHLVAKGREALVRRRAFLRRLQGQPGLCAGNCLRAAHEAGARWIVLCDTNGGTLPGEIGRITGEVIAAGIPGERLGIHTHNDTETAVAGSLAAIEAGARQVQGTLNGLGERCGNANLTSLIPTLLLKEPWASRFETGIAPAALAGLTRTSRMLDDILNRVPMRQAPYVGASAFAHKAGLHASAIVKNPATYEHIDPAASAMHAFIPMSNQAGQSNLRRRLAEAGIEVEDKDPALAEILQEIKAREDEGYSYDTAQASFELSGAPRARHHAALFRGQALPRDGGAAEEQVRPDGQPVGGRRRGEDRRPEDAVGLRIHGRAGLDRGPVNALAKALAKDLGPYQSYIDDIRLVDFKVRITQGGTEAVTRVVIDSEDSMGRRWATVGVSANIVDASFEALLDAIEWKLVRDGASAA
jgi:2-isopropylmalate synthase